MFKVNYDGFESLLCSINNDPLELWSKYISLDGSIKRVKDQLLNGDGVIEIIGKTARSNSVDCIPTTLTCPADSKDFLRSKLPILVLVLKNLRLEGKLEFQFLDQQDYRRKFVLITNSTREKIPKVTPSSVFLPFILEDDWNLLELNLQNLSKDFFGTDYKFLQRITLHPNFRFRRIYLQDRHYERDEIIQNIQQALTDVYNLKKSLTFTDKNCQTQSIFLHSIPVITMKK
ncbi:cilia- and flagella-associated protein 20-like, partial [Chelonus insularis]|uniref:cilia- and flagella-associated protein 20-like n=1 Tax=Chelonus insularis TaxID=460826 RepID=UPI00158BF1F5